MQIVSERRLLCAWDDHYLFYKGGRIFLCDNIDDKGVPLLLPQASIIALLASRLRIAERVLRLEPRFAVPLDSKSALLSQKGHMYRVDIEKMTISVECDYRLGMSNPLHICACEPEEGCPRFLFGEYFANKNKEEVRVFERNIAGDWETKYTFPGGTIGHIHNIVYDRFRQCFWILTGDTNSECGIWRASLDFGSVDLVAGGDQSFRACFASPSKSGLVYATDSPDELNHIFFLNLMLENPSQELLYEMPGPCIFGKLLGNGNTVFSTSVEPDSRTTGLAYLVRRTTGEGVADRYSHIIAGDIDNGFEEIFKAKKDCLFMGLFQFGNIVFPYIEGENDLVFSGLAVHRLDDKTAIIQLKKGEVGFE